MLLKKTVYDELVAKVDNIDTSDFVLKTMYNTDKTELEKKIPNVTNFVKKTKLTLLENKHFKVITNTDYFLSRKSKRLSAESIKPPTTCDNSLTPALNYYGTKKRVKLTGTCLKEPNISYTHGKVVSIYIVYELGASSSHNPTLKNCLIGAVNLTKDADIDKYGYSGYGIGFDRRSSFSFPGSGFGQNVLIFGVDMSFSDILIIRKKTY